MKRKFFKLAMSLLLLGGALAGFVPKTSEAVGFGYTCPPLCAIYNRFGDCICQNIGYPVGNGYCYYEPCTIGGTTLS